MSFSINLSTADTWDFNFISKTNKSLNQQNLHLLNFFISNSSNHLMKWCSSVCLDGTCKIDSYLSGKIFHHQKSYFKTSICHQNSTLRVNLQGKWIS